MASLSDQAILTGEVEIDGCHVGGFVRPKNTKKTESDHRKVPYRAPERRRVVTAARQRGHGGAIRTWVGEREGYAKRQIVSAVAKDAVIFSDAAAHWNDLGLSHKHLQVNHKRTYCSPSACTNAVESYFATLRKLESTYRHISQNYMDFYAAEAAFRTVHNKSTTTERFGVLMGAMARSGRSEITGYFQGRKRACRTVNADGSPGEWRPPTRAERDLARRREGKAVTPGPLRPRRTAGTWQSGFSYVSAAEFLASPAAVPDQPGVYTLLLEGGRELLGRCGYQCDGRPLVTHADHDHLYTGESYGMRTRLLQHLTGGFETSPMRAGLLALHVEYGVLDDALGLCSRRAATEAALSAWMEKKVLIGFRESPRARDYEADILKWTASPLNSQRAEAEGFLGILRQAKAQLVAVSDRWEPAPKIDHIRRRR